MFIESYMEGAPKVKEVILYIYFRYVDCDPFCISRRRPIFTLRYQITNQVLTVQYKDSVRMTGVVRVARLVVLGRRPGSERRRPRLAPAHAVCACACAGV